MSEIADPGFVARAPGYERKVQLVAFNELNGGTHSGERCASTSITYKLPGGRTTQVGTVGCNDDAKLLVAYRRGDGEPGIATACMNDDAMHLWPRFSTEARGRPEELA